MIDFQSGVGLSEVGLDDAIPLSSLVLSNKPQRCVPTTDPPPRGWAGITARFEQAKRSVGVRNLGLPDLTGETLC
jgi:hypothetical protein